MTKTEDALEAGLSQQPISVAIQSSVLTGNCGTNVDHGVLSVVRVCTLIVLVNGVWMDMSLLKRVLANIWDNVVFVRMHHILH